MVMDFNGINLFIGLKNAVWCVIKLSEVLEDSTNVIIEPWILALMFLCVQQSKQYQDDESYWKGLVKENCSLAGTWFVQGWMEGVTTWLKLCACFFTRFL